MRFLVDASLSPAVAPRLADEGHDALHVGDALPLDSPDATLLTHAATEVAQALLLLSHLPDVEHDLAQGAVVVIEETRIRVRRLPLGK